MERTETKIPSWLLETLVENVTALLNNDASPSKVMNKLIGGLRALGDVPSVPEDDPILIEILSIVDDLELSAN